jgi:hypothetical protein
MCVVDMFVRHHDVITRLAEGATPEELLLEQKAKENMQ